MRGKKKELCGHIYLPVLLYLFIQWTFPECLICAKTHPDVKSTEMNKTDIVPIFIEFSIAQIRDGESLDKGL